MKKIFYVAVLLLFSANSVVGQIKRPPVLGYVDLDLPSGTLWKEYNEGCFTMTEAIKKFGNQIPTNDQTIELQAHCTWAWEGNGYRVTGKNGKSIFLPADGYYDCNNDLKGYPTEGYYMHRDKSWENKYSVGFSFTSTGRGGYMSFLCYAISVRLVK